MDMLKLAGSNIERDCSSGTSHVDFGQLSSLIVSEVNTHWDGHTRKLHRIQANSRI
jgi:hypothetical protein